MEYPADFEEIYFIFSGRGVVQWKTDSGEIREQVTTSLGKALKPDRVLFVTDLPKTRNAKVLRRVIRAVYLGNDPGDLSSLENPATLEAIRSAS